MPQQRVLPESPVKVAFIGAGGVNFGSVEGPWDHATRLERILGDNLLVTAIINRTAARRENVLAKKRASPAAAAYRGTREFSDLPSYLASFTAGNDDDRDATHKLMPDIVLIGLPPAFHGSTADGVDLEIQLSKHLGDATVLFVEKPMSCSPADDVKRVGDYLEERRTIVSVGYFMRYLKAVQKMKEIIETNKLTVMTTVARYFCSYEYIAKRDWWMKSVSCSPIVEQGTHFCDLSRYFGGDVDVSSVLAHAVEHDDAPGALSKIPIDEASIPESDRVPRVTAAVWKYASGAVGSMVHGINLQGKKYDCELEVLADGWKLRLVDPYYNPQLRVRSPGGDEEKIYTFPGDDPYLNQMIALVTAVRSGRSAGILSSWEDAAKTYELTWAIRYASEEAKKKQG